MWYGTGVYNEHGELVAEVGAKKTTAAPLDDLAPVPTVQREVRLNLAEPLIEENTPGPASTAAVAGGPARATGDSSEDIATDSAILPSSGEAGALDCNGDDADLSAAFVSPLSKLEKAKQARLCRVIDLEANGISDTATELILDNLKGKDSLSKNELAICGALLQAMFKEEERKKRRGVPVSPRLVGATNNRSFRVARVPTLYNVAGSRRLNRDRRRVLREWLDVLDGAWEGVIFDTAMNANPKLAQPFVVDFFNKHMRPTAEETTQLLTFVRMNPTMARRFMRIFAHITKGIYPLAPITDVIELKQRYLAEAHATLRVEKMKLDKKMRKGKQSKGASASRNVHASVAKVDPLELVLVSVGGLVMTGRFVESEKRFNTPFERHRDFEDTACIVIKMDTGSQSCKGALCPVNVANPQGTQHAKVFIEWDEKDSLENAKRVGFGKGNKIREGCEQILNRQCVVAVVTHGAEQRAVIAVNTGEGHDYEAPSPLPKFDAVRHNDRSNDGKGTRPTIEQRVALFDFAAATSTKLLYNKDVGFLGLAFLSGRTAVVSEAYFAEPIEANSAVGAELQQIVLCGVFTSDLCFDSEFFGHQGASATFPCLFCLVTLSDLTTCFTEHRCMMYEERTIDDIFACAETYNEEYASLAAHEQKPKVRSQVTQTMTKSIVAAPGLRCQMIDVSRAGMHVNGGITSLIVEWTRQGLGHIERLEAATPSREHVQSKQSIEAAIKLAKEYEAFLNEQLKGTIDVAKQQKEELDSVMPAIIVAEQQLISDDLSEDGREMLRAQLEELRDSHERKQVVSEEGMQTQLLLMQQLCVAVATREELEIYLNKHEGHSTRATLAGLKDNGVDIQTYFYMNLLGNHCMTFGANCEKIYDDILTNFSACIGDSKHQELADQFIGKMKAIATKWHRIQLVLKSVEKQTDAAIAQFEKDTGDLRELFFDLVQFATTNGMEGIELPTKVKTHLLFDGCLLRQLRYWGTIGGFNEESIESAHAVWNALMRQFASTRGWRKKELVLKEFLYRGADFIWEGIEDMLQATKREKGPRAKDRSEWKTPQRNVVELVEVETGDSSEILEPELSDLEEKINETDVIHPTLEINGNGMCESGLDTRIVVCGQCCKHVLAYALGIHKHEAHSGNIISLKSE